MYIKAKFKGQDGSLGYRNGKTYRLHFRTIIKNALTLGGDVIVIVPEKVSEAGRCEYSSLRSFLNNWQILN